VNGVSSIIDACGTLKTEYFQIVDGHTLQPVTDWNQADSIVGCIAVFCGNVRLIDNIRYK
jgi:pantoate--beta-alanine ligase